MSINGKIPGSTLAPNLNRLLAALPTEDLARLSEYLELVELPLGQLLYGPGEEMRHAYFPVTAVVSLHYVLESGASAESAGVGKEGVVGISLFMGGDTTPSSAVVQVAGYGYRLDSQLLKKEFMRGGLLQQILLRYTQALIIQMTQTAACNRHHSLEQQLCRWFLLTLDRADSHDIIITQQLIANMLGVRREGVTGIASDLQRAGFIRYRRGHISLLDRHGLQTRVCECYEIVRDELDRLLSDVRYRHDSLDISDRHALSAMKIG